MTHCLKSEQQQLLLSLLFNTHLVAANLSGTEPPLTWLSGSLHHPSTSRLMPACQCLRFRRLDKPNLSSLTKSSHDNEADSMIKHIMSTGHHHRQQQLEPVHSHLLGRQGWLLSPLEHLGSGSQTQILLTAAMSGQKPAPQPQISAGEMCFQCGLQLRPVYV